MKGEFSFGKNQRLCNKIDIERLFSEGKSLFGFPFKAIYIADSASQCFNKQASSLQIVISVGKRYSKRATERNKIKRRAREAYRLNQNIAKAISECGLKAKLALVYISKKEEDYSTIENGIKKILHALSVEVSASAHSHTSSSD